MIRFQIVLYFLELMLTNNLSKYVNTNSGVKSPTTMIGGTFMNNIREGLIPVALGSAVTAAGLAMKQSNGINKMVVNTIFGFRLAHIVLGAIDLVEHRSK